MHTSMSPKQIDATIYNSNKRKENQKKKINRVKIENKMTVQAISRNNLPNKPTAQ